MQRLLPQLVIFATIVVMVATALLPITSSTPIKVTQRNFSPVATTTVSIADNTNSSANAHNVGARTCASSTCHGSPRPDIKHANMIRRDEYTIWLEQDPHSRAYADLNSLQGKQIFDKLGLTKNGKIPHENKARYQTTYNNCLQCHATAIESLNNNGDLETIATEGISCESCHGAASNWRTTHYTTDFTGLSTVEKTKQGLTDVGNLWQRTNACVKCHVGSGTAEVNHDLIAAGHPVLKFEMTAYSSQMPKHWKSLPATTPPEKHRETHLWLMGQISSLTSSLEQLLARANQPSTPSSTNSELHQVWPELSESNCYACHHDLDVFDTWRPSIADPQAGHKHLLAVNDWYACALAAIARVEGSAGNERAHSFYANWQLLTNSLEKTLSPDPAEVAIRCKSTLSALNDWLAPAIFRDNQHHPKYDHQRLVNLTAATMQEDGINHILQNWDRATQTYLALYAFSSTQDAQGKTTVDSSTGLSTVRDLLSFPIHKDYRFASPSNFKGLIEPTEASANNRSEIRAELVKIINQLKPSASQDE
jgi:hypothetical protein